MQKENKRKTQQIKSIITLLKLESMLFLRIWVEYPPPPLAAAAVTAATSDHISLLGGVVVVDVVVLDALALLVLPLLFDVRATRRSLLEGDKIEA